MLNFGSENTNQHNATTGNIFDHQSALNQQNTSTFNIFAQQQPRELTSAATNTFENNQQSTNIFGNNQQSRNIFSFNKRSLFQNPQGNIFRNNQKNPFEINQQKTQQNPFEQNQRLKLDNPSGNSQQIKQLFAKESNQFGNNQNSFRNSGSFNSNSDSQQVFKNQILNQAQPFKNSSSYANVNKPISTQSNSPFAVNNTCLFGSSDTSLNNASQSLFENKHVGVFSNAQVQQKRDQLKNHNNIFGGSVQNSVNFSGFNSNNSNNFGASNAQNSDIIGGFNNNNSLFGVNNTQNSGSFGDFNNSTFGGINNQNSGSFGSFNKNISSFESSNTANIKSFGANNNGSIFGNNFIQKSPQPNNNQDTSLFKNSTNLSFSQSQQGANANRSPSFGFGVSHPHGPQCSQQCPYFNTFSNNCIFNRPVPQPAPQPAPQPPQPLQINLNIQYSLPLNFNMNGGNLFGGANYIGISQAQQIFQLGMQAFNYQQPYGLFGGYGPTSNNFKIEFNHSFSQNVQGNVRKVKESTKMRKVFNNTGIMRNSPKVDQQLFAPSLKKQENFFSQNKVDCQLISNNTKQCGNSSKYYQKPKNARIPSKDLVKGVSRPDNQAIKQNRINYLKKQRQLNDSQTQKQEYQNIIKVPIPNAQQTENYSLFDKQALLNIQSNKKYAQNMARMFFKNYQSQQINKIESQFGYIVQKADDQEQNEHEQQGEEQNQEQRNRFFN